MDFSTGNLAWWLPALVPSYLILCSSLRYRRRNEMQKSFPDRASLAKMTITEAQVIVTKLTELEFPFTVLTSLQFALFKTYGIPTISQLLVDTQQLAHVDYSDKRYTDTTILIQEFSAHHPQSERSIKAMARMNYIHSRYQKAGKISNNDMLYTLSVFITEPISWVDKYEWRVMSDAEKNALATHWKSVGDSMQISYHPLARQNWADGLEFYEDIKTWAENYEQSDMVPGASNKKICDELVPLLLHWVPGIARPFAEHIIGTIMGSHLRKAMVYPVPPLYYTSIVDAIFGIRKFVLRYLSLPRPEFLAVIALSDPDPITGLMHKNDYLVRPYYVKPSFWNSWGPFGWFVRLNGGDVPGSKADLYEPEGYKIEEVGPRSMKGKGEKEMKKWQEKISGERSIGCPFAFGAR